MLEQREDEHREIARGKVDYVREDQELLDTANYIEKAQNLLVEMGWHSENLGDPSIGRKMVQKATMNGESVENVDNFQAAVYLDFSRTISVNNTSYKIIGKQGSIRMTLNNDGSLIKATREIAPDAQLSTGKYQAIKTYEKALEEARARLPNEGDYEVEGWEFGYEEKANDDNVTIMEPVFRFEFERAFENSENQKEQVITINAIEQMP